jgi:hypothetical protein
MRERARCCVSAAALDRVAEAALHCTARREPRQVWTLAIAEWCGVVSASGLRQALMMQPAVLVLLATCVGHDVEAAANACACCCAVVVLRG